jgi:release factor glutamine methyltransferase
MIRQQLANAKARLASVSPSASLDAQLLLAEVLNVSRAYILAHGEEILTDEQIEAYEGLIRRREAGEPIAYILGRKPFYDREFVVSPAVLIPRPETELLLEWALQIADRDGVRTVVDVGAGSGALAVTFAALRPQIKVYAVDVSEAALQVAQENARLNDVQVEFLHGSLLQPLIERNLKADLVMANLPYIARDEVPTLEVSRYEPHLALDGGGDGLDLIRELLRQAPQACSSGAAILLEIGADQGEAMLRLGQAFAEVELRQDYAGLDRMVRVKL